MTGSDKQIEFVAQLSKKVPIKVFTLAKPYRVIIDLPEVKFQFPKGQGRKGKGLVSAYRYGLFAKGKSRIVLDVRRPVRVEKAQVVAGKNGAEMEIRLVRTNAKTFTLNLSKRILLKELEETPELRMPKAKSAPKQTVRKSRDDARPVIVIDPGHGGVDPGAIGAKGTLEKDVVLMFSKELKKKLDGTGLFKVEMTRDIDTYIPLHRRVQIGRDKGADLFISIHADSISRKKRRHTVRGASIYVLSDQGSDEEARALAAKENRSDVIAGYELPDSENPVADILIELAQRATNQYSMMFASLQRKSWRRKIRMHGDRTRSAGFRVLKAPDVPSVLIELGYLSSRYDEQNLKSGRWRDKMATAIVRSVKVYFNQKVAKSPF